MRNKRVKELVAEFCQTLHARFPDSEFDFYEGEDPQGVYIDVHTSAELWDIIDTASERTTDILLDEGYYIGVVPLAKREHR